MPFWSDTKWAALPDDQKPVAPFDKKCLEEAKYIMAIGDEIYLSSSVPGNTIRTLKDAESFQIAPGQFAFILTKEVVKIPLDAIGFISINARTKFNGLVNISGFHVDPGYDGRLLFSVFNAGPTEIHLRHGQPIFPLWIASLNEMSANAKIKKGYEHIDPNLITTISGNYTTTFELANVMRGIRNEIDTAKVDISQIKAGQFQRLVMIVIVTFFLGIFLTSGVKFTYDVWVYGHPWFEPPPSSTRGQPQPLPVPAPPQISPSVPPSPQQPPASPPGNGAPHG